jgi:L-glutamine-phosphate cytidylyltransferase
MKAIILAAGKPEIGDGPISNLDVSAQRLLDLQVSCLRSCGIDKIVLVAGYGSAQIVRADVDVRVNDAWEGRGSLSSLRFVANSILDGEDVLIIYGDTVFEPEVLKSALHSNGAVCPVCFLDRRGRDKGNFREYAVIENGALQSIVAQPDDHGVRTVFTGITLVRGSKTAALRNYLLNGSIHEKAHVGSLLNEMCLKGVDLTPVIIERGWAEITSTELYQEMRSNVVFLKKLTDIHTDWTSRAKKYDRLQWVNNDSLLSAITEIGASLSPATVLDVGTGTGKVLFALKDVLHQGEFWGIDSSQSMLDKIARKNEAVLKCTSIESAQDIPSRHFDLITARMVFHHINEPERALQSICRALKPDGALLICEGVPPTQRTAPWYTEMFRYKEDRKTITEVDLINMLLRAGFDDVVTRTIVMRNCSLNNWLDNSGIPPENIDIIKRMHYEAPDYVRDDYDMVYTDDDCLMTWKFAVTYGRFKGGAA